MKRLLALMLFAVSLGVMAQGTSFYDYPFNPDANGDDVVGVADLQSFLALYGQTLGGIPEQCTYDGSSIEQFLAGLLNGDVVLDSVFVEYEVQDVSTYFIPGCPDAQTDTVLVAYTGIWTSVESSSSFAPWDFRFGGDNHWFYVYYSSSSGTTSLRFENSYLEQLGYIQDGFFDSENSQTNGVGLPFPIEWQYDEDGISLPWANGWALHANYIHILPYWHYAE